MSALDEILTRAVADRDAPFLVGAVASSDGLLWEGAAGWATSTAPAGPDTVFRLFSMTKAIGSACALILLDRGQLTLDTPVASVLPEFNEIQVLDSIGSDGPVLRPPRTTCTLRHLLTHTSGFAYATFCSKQAAYQQLPGAPDIHDGRVASLHYPLMFDPGEGFVYGISTDWVGRMVERIDGRRIDRFCQEEIFDPLRMSHTFFELGARADRLAAVKIRNDDGRFEDTAYAPPPPNPEVYGIGYAVYGTAPDYLRFLQMVLRGGELDERRILSTHAVELLRENQMTPGAAVGALPAVLDSAEDVDFFPETRTTWTAAFLRNEADIPHRRSGGSLTWAGFLNTHYWIDPDRDIAAVLMTQLLPFNDRRFLQTYVDFERAVYRTSAPPGRHDQATNPAPALTPDVGMGLADVRGLSRVRSRTLLRRVIRIRGHRQGDLRPLPSPTGMPGIRCDSQ